MTTTTPRTWLRALPISSRQHGDDLTSAPTDGKHWERCRRLMTNYDDSIAEDWKQEIQNQLLVSTLLSAVTTAFVVETQKELYEDPMKTSAFALLQILKQLNQSVDLETSIEPFTKATSANELINVFWFTSLALSLATATIGLLCLQWIQEYKKDAPHLPHEKYLDVRHFRHIGFERWGAKAIISLLPLLLILSLVTFFGGLLTFLGTISWTVAIPVYIILLATFALLLFTTFAPGIAALCVCFSTQTDQFINPPFRSLQSWLILKFMLGVAWVFRRRRDLKRLLECHDWIRVDSQWTTWMPIMCGESLRPLLDLFSDNRDNLAAIYLATSEVEKEKTFSTYDRRGHLGRFETLESKMFSFLVWLLRGQGRLSNSLPDAWKDHLLEVYIQAGDKAKDSEETRFVDGMDRELLISTIWTRTRLDLLLQLLHALLHRFRPTEPRSAMTVPMIWATVAQVLAHPSLPPEDMSSIVAETMDLMEQAPALEVISWSTCFTEVVAKSEMPKARQILYYLSRHTIWEKHLARDRSFVTLVVDMGAEEVIESGFQPPMDWPPVIRRERPSAAFLDRRSSLISEKMTQEGYIADSKTEGQLHGAKLVGSTLLDTAFLSSGPPLNSPGYYTSGADSHRADPAGSLRQMTLATDSEIRLSASDVEAASHTCQTGRVVMEPDVVP